MLSTYGGLSCILGASKLQEISYTVVDPFRRRLVNFGSFRPLQLGADPETYLEDVEARM